MENTPKLYFIGCDCMENDYLTDDDNIAIVVSYIRLPDDFPQEITDPKPISSYPRGLIDRTTIADRPKPLEDCVVVRTFDDYRNNNIRLDCLHTSISDLSDLSYEDKLLIKTVMKKAEKYKNCYG